MSHRGHLFGFGLFVVLCVLLCRPLHGDDFTIEDARAELVEFEQCHWGLSYERKNQKAKSESVVKVSNDGSFVRVSGKQAFKGGVLFFGKYANEVGHWSFSTTRRDPPLTGYGIKASSPHIVTFFEDDSRASAVCLTLEGGFLHTMSFSDYVNESKVQLVKLKMKGHAYNGIRCVHRSLSDVTFLFDKDNADLKFVVMKYKKGDIVSESKHTKVEKLQSDWGRFIMGPILYGKLDSKKVILGFDNKTEDSGVYSAETTVVLENHKLLDKRLDGLIDLPEFNIKNGDRIHSQGQPALEYEYQDGKIVLRVDGNAVKAAEKARYARSRGGWIRYYTIAGSVLVLSLIIFVWYRNDNE